VKKIERLLAVFLLIINCQIVFCQDNLFPIKIDFENVKHGNVCDLHMLRDQLGLTVPFVNGFEQERAIIDSLYAHKGDNSLRVLYPKGNFGPHGTGVQTPIKFEPQEEVYMCYSLRFSENFTYGTTNFGGKLPGLATGKLCCGGQTCNGENGFTARFMFHENGVLLLYLYHMDKPGKYGHVFKVYNEDGSLFTFNKGQWYTITERVKINTGNNFDGEVQCWLDGREVLALDSIRFVNNGDKIDNLFFSTFHGGGSNEYAPIEDCYIWFDDIIISNRLDDIF